MQSPNAVLQAVVPLLASRDAQLRQVCSQAVQDLWAADQEGAVACEAVQLIAGGFVRLSSCKVRVTLLSLAGSVKPWPVRPGLPFIVNEGCIRTLSEVAKHAHTFQGWMSVSDRVKQCSWRLPETGSLSCRCRQALQVFLSQRTSAACNFKTHASSFVELAKRCGAYPLHVKCLTALTDVCVLKDVLCADDLVAWLSSRQVYVYTMCLHHHLAHALLCAADLVKRCNCVCPPEAVRLLLVLRLTEASASDVGNPAKGEAQHEEDACFAKG